MADPASLPQNIVDLANAVQTASVKAAATNMSYGQSLLAAKKVDDDYNKNIAAQTQQYNTDKATAFNAVQQQAAQFKTDLKALQDAKAALAAAIPQDWPDPADPSLPG